MTVVGDFLGEQIEVVALLPCFFLDLGFVMEVFFEDLFETELSFLKACFFRLTCYLVSSSQKLLGLIEALVISNEISEMLSSE